MSHYAVLVIGENVVEQLAKFDENLDMPRYVAYTKQALIEKERASIENYKKNYYDEYLADPVKYAEGCKENAGHLKYISEEFPKKLQWTDEEVYAEATEYYEESEIGADGEVYSTRNPNSKWDWFQIGGRYRDRLPIKAGGTFQKGEGMTKYVGSLYADSKPNCGDIAMKKDIDWTIAHQNKIVYDKAIRFWEMKVEGAEAVTEEEKEEMKWDWYKEGYYTDKYKDKATYATAMANFTMWAIVIDGVWYEKGEMGWFGMSSEGLDEGLVWELNFYDKFIKDLPEDTILTVVDCHI